MPAPADIPCSARKNTKAPMCCDKAQPAEAAVKTKSPQRTTGRRPKLSDSAPWINRDSDNIRSRFEYAVNDDWRPAETRRETVTVRGGEPVEIDVVVTRHALPLSGQPGGAPEYIIPGPFGPSKGITVLSDTPIRLR